MKDLIQEGRKIYETFKKKVNENVSYEYASEVQKAYVEMAKSASPMNGWKFFSARDQNLAGTSNDWVKKTPTGKQIDVTFEPFQEGESSFFVLISVNHSPVGDDQEFEKKFEKTVNSTNDVEKDAKMALDYIRKILTSPEIQKY